MHYSSTTLSAGHTFLESPRWHKGDLYVSDFFTKRVLKFPRGDNDFEVVLELPSTPSGLGFLPSGDLLVVSMEDRSILRAHDGEISLHADLSKYSPFLLNDMFVDGSGRCYVGGLGHSAGDESDFGPQPLIFVQSDGSVEALDADLNFPNGIVGSKSQLFIAETYAGSVRVLSLDQAGRPHSPRVWAQFGGRPLGYDIESAHEQLEVEPDGLAVGKDGTLWVADAKGHGVARVREGGEVVDFVETGPLSTFAAVESADGDRLFLCCSPSNRTVDWSALTSSELRVASLSSDR